MDDSISQLTGAQAWDYIFSAYAVALVILLSMLLLSWRKFRLYRDKLHTQSQHDA
jgi:hypothetical protein